MEALAQLVQAIVAFIIEVTVHAAVFIFLLLTASFSPSYRKRLRAQWDTSNWQRFAIVFGITMYSGALVVALLVWTRFAGNDTGRSAPTEHNRSITIKMSDEEVQRMTNTKGIDELVDVAGDIIKRKLAKRKQETDQNADVR